MGEFWEGEVGPFGFPVGREGRDVGGDVESTGVSFGMGCVRDGYDSPSIRRETGEDRLGLLVCGFWGGEDCMHKKKDLD